MGAPKGNQNAIKHGLKAHTLPPGCGSIYDSILLTRSDLFQAVEEQKGTVSDVDKAHINSAIRCEAVSALAMKYLRDAADDIIDHSSRATYLKMHADYSIKRNREIEKLGLSAKGQSGPSFPVSLLDELGEEIAEIPGSESPESANPESENSDDINQLALGKEAQASAAVASDDQASDDPDNRPEDSQDDAQNGESDQHAVETVTADGITGDDQDDDQASQDDESAKLGHVRTIDATSDQDDESSDESEVELSHTLAPEITSPLDDELAKAIADGIQTKISASDSEPPKHEAGVSLSDTDDAPFVVAEAVAPTVEGKPAKFGNVDPAD